MRVQIDSYWKKADKKKACERARMPRQINEPIGIYLERARHYIAMETPIVDASDHG